MRSIIASTAPHCCMLHLGTGILLKVQSFQLAKQTCELSESSRKKTILECSQLLFTQLCPEI